MDVREVAPNEYQNVYDLRDYAFRHVYSGSKLADFKYWVENSAVIGSFDQQKLAGQLIVLPLNIYFEGQQLSMGGIGFVATYPEYRGKGVMKELIIAALKKMHDDGQIVSVLGPFSIAFYRHFGWEVFFDKVNYKVVQEKYPNPKLSEELQIERYQFVDVPMAIKSELFSFYNEEVKKENGGMNRNEAWWQRLVSRESSDTVTLFRRANRIVGYVRYEINDVVLNIHDYVATDLNVEAAIWHYLTSHRSNVFEINGETSIQKHINFTFNNPQISQNIIQDCMIRLVDVFAFLKKCRFELADNEKLYLNVQDQFAEWNTGLYCISKQGIEKIAMENTVDLDQQLTLPINLASSLLFGYLSVADCLYQTKQTMTTSAQILWQKALINKEKPVFYEHF